jgi:hypothetical protein
MRRLQSLILGWNAVLQAWTFVIRATRQHTNMPPKRALPTPTDEHSPPPTQRPAIEHHLSPVAGHHPDTPADAAVAISTPPRMQDQNADIQPPHETPSGNIGPNGAGPIPAVSPAPQAALAIEPAQSTASNGGARAAYAATQQQRVITCNINAIPTSTCTHLTPHTSPHERSFMTSARWTAAENSPHWNTHCHVLPTTWTSSQNVHAGCGQRRRCWCDRMG